MVFDIKFSSTIYLYKKGFFTDQITVRQFFKKLVKGLFMILPHPHLVYPQSHYM